MDNNEYDYMVSICCLTFNHEKYLRQALDSVFMQKVEFPIEVIIAEDYSTDNSRIIIDEYAALYPEIVKVIYRDKNVGARQNLFEACSKSKGKYLIVLETDDYWTDPFKIQKQVDFLETHPQVLAVTHRCRMIDENDNYLNLKYPEKSTGYYSWFDLLNDKMPGQTTSVMTRNYYLNNDIDLFLIHNPYCAKGPGDRRRYFTLKTHGEIFCLDSEMSNYRFVRNKGFSYSATNEFSMSDGIAYYEDFINYCIRINANGLPRLVADCLYIRALWIPIIHRNTKVLNVQGLVKKYKKCKYKVFGTIYVMYYYFVRLIRGSDYFYKRG